MKTEEVKDRHLNRLDRELSQFMHKVVVYTMTNKDGLEEENMGRCVGAELNEFSPTVVMLKILSMSDETLWLESTEVRLAHE